MRNDEMFRMFPRGQCQHELCVRSWRLPHSYGTSANDTPCYLDQRALSGSIMAGRNGIHVTPKGEPCCITQIKGVPTIICGGQTYSVPWLNSNKESGNLRLIGFSKDGKPVTQITIYVGNNPTPSRYMVFKGQDLLFEDPLGIYNPLLLNNDELLYQNGHISGNTEFRIRVQGKTMYEKTMKCHKFFQDSTGTIFALVNVADGRGRIRDLVKLSNVHRSPVISSRELVDIVASPSGIICIVKRVDGALATNTDGTGFDEFIGRFQYRSDYLELKDGFAYIGEPARDTDETSCWIVKNERQPSFQQVSSAFRADDGSWCYYGVVGRHVMLMQFPLDASNDPDDQNTRITVKPPA